jgi:hypothetical protein
LKGQHPPFDAVPKYHWHANCNIPRKPEIAGMNYWHGRPLHSLAHADIERAANEAISELVGLREIHQKRENFDMLVLSFGFGAAFSSIAIFIGVSLHS